MPVFGKSALTYKYFWSDNEHSCRYTFFSGDDIINRTNGYHILDFINRFMMIYGLISHESFSRVEHLICRHMPAHINSRHDMKMWLSKNWNRRI
jgi:hypothetical protein